MSFLLVMSMQGALTFLYVEKYMAHEGNVEQITGYLFSMIGQKERKLSLH